MGLLCSTDQADLFPLLSGHHTFELGCVLIYQGSTIPPH
jgi:hypothetical protein